MNSCVYRNLHNQLISIKQHSLVVGHASSVTIKNPTFTVNQKGRERVIALQQKNVHAFVCGNIVNVDAFKSYKSRDVIMERSEDITVRDGILIKYNPYRDVFFHADGKPDLPECIQYVTVHSDGRIIAQVTKTLTS